MMTGKIRKNNRLAALSFGLHNFLGIVAADNALNGSIYRLRGLHSAIAIDEYKSSHTVNHRIISSILVLLLADHLKCIIHHIKQMCIRDRDQIRAAWSGNRKLNKKAYVNIET